MTEINLLLCFNFMEVCKAIIFQQLTWNRYVGTGRPTKHLFVGVVLIRKLFYETFVIMKQIF